MQTDQPRGSLQETFDISIALPAAPKVQTAYLRDAVRQTQAVMDAGARQMAGMLAFFVTPKVRGVSIKLARCCGETATVGTDTLKQDGRGEIKLPPTC